MNLFIADGELIRSAVDPRPGGGLPQSGGPDLGFWRAREALNQDPPAG